METFGKLENDEQSNKLKKNHISNVLQILSKCENLKMRLKVLNKLLADKRIKNPNKNLRYMLCLLQKGTESVSFFLGTLGNSTHWYNFETLPQTDDFRRATVESAHIVQSVHSIARWKTK